VCEYCSDFKTWAKPLREAEVTVCERIADDPNDDWPCQCPATWRIYVRHADSHLCPRHVAEQNRRLDAGMGQPVGRFGVQASVDFLPVSEDSTCDHTDLYWEAGLRRCGEPATHVKVVTEEWHRCDEHTAHVQFRRT
jgi:hypothetical protein